MKILKSCIVLLIFLGIVVGLWVHWRQSTLYPSTDDAYIQANVVTIAPEVTGQVIAVHVQENQQVNAGDPLFDIDSTVYDNAVTQSQTALDSANDATSSFVEQVSASEVSVESAISARDTAQTQLDRMQQLSVQGDVAQSQLDSARTDAATAQSALSVAQAALSSAKTDLASHRNELVSIKAQLQTAQLDLERTRVVAPVNGWVTNLSMRSGSIVSAYESVFSMVDNSQWWVNGNFKETDLGRIVVGQPVSFDVDMLPGVSFAGTVDSIAFGSGSTFSLLPAENASGNWVKVTQRFTVRVSIDEVDARMRVGASARVAVDTTGNSK